MCILDLLETLLYLPALCLHPRLIYLLALHKQDKPQHNYLKEPQEMQLLIRYLKQIKFYLKVLLNYKVQV